VIHFPLQRNEKKLIGKLRKKSDCDEKKRKTAKANELGVKLWPKLRPGFRSFILLIKW